MRRALFLLAVLATVSIIAGCGGSSGSASTVAPVSTTGVSPTATGEVGQAATSTTAQAATADDAVASYREDVNKWSAKWTPKVEERLGVLDDLDPLTVTDDQIKAVGKCADVVNDAAKAFKSIKPPASLAHAHRDYASLLQGMANGLERFQKALDARELSGLMEALGAFEALTENADATKTALEQAAGVKLIGGATDAQAPATTSPADQITDVGSRDNPVPLGTTQQVGDWAVTVVEYTPDATAAVLEANQFNDKPPAGETYVLVAVTAQYVGEESGTFWIDMSYKFLAKSGNTFDSAMAVAPKPISDAGETFPGASVSGNLLYQVPTGQATGGLLIVEPTFSFSREARMFFALQ